MTPEQIETLLASLPAPSPSPDLGDRFLHRVERHRREAASRTRRIRVLVPLAAAIVIGGFTVWATLKVSVPQIAMPTHAKQPESNADVTPQVGNKAEQLCKRMAGKFAKAKTVQLELHTRYLSEGDRWVDREVTMFLEGKKALIVTIDKPGHDHSSELRIVSNGETLLFIIKADGEEFRRVAQDLPADFENRWKQSLPWFPFSGYGGKLLSMLDPKLLETAAKTRRFDYQLVSRDPNTTECRVRFTMKTEGSDLTATIETWINETTLIPSRRVLHSQLNGRDLELIEIFRSIRFDEPIDPKVFEIPEEEKK